MQLEEYDAIQSAVMETARGRWFLEEFARRHRVADTEMLLAAISRLEDSISRDPIQSSTDIAPETDATRVPLNDSDTDTIEELHLQVAELSAAIQLTRQEIKELGAQQAHDGGFAPDADEIDDIFEHTEQAVSDILRAAEAMQASSWAAREDGTDTDICDRLDKCAIEIYTACTFQELTGQRIAKLISLMSFTEGRVQTMLQRWQEGNVSKVSQAEAISEEKPTGVPVDDNRPADVFEASPIEDFTEAGSHSSSLKLPDDAGTSYADTANDHDPFEGQDTFVSTQDTLKNVSRS
ncbi:MAG: hypothetical protein V7703_00080 [Hyphomicrobiales bacterium]